MIESQTISINLIVTQREGNIVSDMDGEKVMLSISNGKYYNLGDIGGAIWDFIVEPISIYQLVSQLVSEYDVEFKECEQQVIDFLTHLKNEGLIELKSEDGMK
ncbi:hypothetical protein J2S74_004013 [Evansella vedderi]|uniref:Lasso peptide biosynthesis PqqD family chaperone n=1 Tax=Evansella vedderi TaxID=38282 RepID=A0ABT9ZZB5_9BACI|nr:lasso peptide biosynthesis PqqD family chaperone [Evansella vedderi]MDQ0256591.1 hypothetical protein [Evansella vedderi]